MGLAEPWAAGPGTERLKELSRRPFVSPGSGDWQSDAILHQQTQFEQSGEDSSLFSSSPQAAL